MNFKVVLAAAALLATQSFAIIGIGGHYAPGFGTKMKAADKVEVTPGIDFSHEGFSGTMQGFGFKLWIDLPNPKFVAMNGDLSLTYPITFIPVIRPYIGGGVTYYLNSFVLNHSFVSGIIDDPAIVDMINAVASKDPAAIQQQAEALENLGQTLKQKVQDKAADEGLNTSIGGHVLVGLRAKLPVIPIAAYCNFKYYFGGDYPKEVDSGNMTLEVGGGFAL